MTDLDLYPPPADLGAAGEPFWRWATERYVLRFDELVLVETASRELDLIARLEAEIAGTPELRATSKRGDEIAHPLIGEVRQHRALLRATLGHLAFVDDDGEADRGVSHLARRAANARWHGDASRRRTRGA